MNMDFVHSRFYDSIWFDMIMYGKIYGNPAMVMYVYIEGLNDFPVVVSFETT